MAAARTTAANSCYIVFNIICPEKGSKQGVIYRILYEGSRINDPEKTPGNDIFQGLEIYLHRSARITVQASLREGMPCRE